MAGPRDRAIRLVCLDVDGTLTEGVGGPVLPGAAEAVRRIRAQLPVRLVTNTTSAPHRALAQHLLGLGLLDKPEALVTPATVARSVLTGRRHASGLLYVDPEAREDFEWFERDELGPAVVLATEGHYLSVADLQPAFWRLLEGATLYTLQRNRYFRRGGELVTDIGPLAAFLAYAFATSIISPPASDARSALLKNATANQSMPFSRTVYQSSAYVGRTFEVLQSVRERNPRIGVALQAYLHRSAEDLEALIASGTPVRVVKGAYREPDNVALQRRRDVDARYQQLARELLAATKRGSRVFFGTHDLNLVERIRSIAREVGVAESAFEIQMLYGIQDAGRRRLAQEGLRTRVLISYGKAWYPWFMRRLAEKPSNLLLVTRNLFS